MRQGFYPDLEQRLRCADPDAIEKLFGEVETAADYVRRTDQWQNGVVAPVGGVRFLDDGIRLDDSLGIKIENTSTLSAITDLDRDSPWEVGIVKWLGGDPADLEIHTIRCRLDPGGGGTDVVTWRMILYIITKRAPYMGATPALFIMPLARADLANGGATLPGDFTFDFTKTLPRPLWFAPTDVEDSDSDSIAFPATVIQILALKADGTPATFGSWVSGGADVTTGGNVLTARRMAKLAGDFGGVWRYTANLSPPNLSIKTSGYVQAVIDFDDPDWLDLGAVPTGTVVFETLERVPFGCSVTYEVRNDADTAWVVFVDGSTTAQLTGVGKRQQYRFRVTLTPNTAANLTPHPISVGVRETTEVELSDVAELTQQTVSVDPITLKGSVSEATLSAIRDGELDFNDRVTTLIAGNQFGKILIRRFIAAPGLAREKWLHMDDWLVEDYELAGPRVTLFLISVLSLLKRRLPPFDTGTGKRVPLIYNGVTLKFGFEDLVQNRLLVPSRRFGPGIEDATTTVSTRIEDSHGKTECDALTHLAGAALIASQGFIKAVDMLSDEKDVVRVFVFEEISELSVTPGFRQRIPEFYVGYDYDFVKKRFKSQVRRFHGPALTNLDLAPIDAPDRLDDAPAKWIDSQALAELVAQRTVDALGTGMILFTVRTNYPYPELEPGDLVTIETDRFVARDPNLSDRGLKGSLFGRGVIQEVRDPWGREFSIWIRSYADLFSAAEGVTVESFAVPEILGVVPDISGVGDVSASVKTKDALSVRIAHDLTAFPTRAVVQAKTAQAVDGDGNLQVLLRNVAESQKLYIAALGYENADGTGSESADLYTVISDAREATIFGEVDVVDGFSAARDTAAPENGNVIITAEGSFAYSNLEDANSNETTFEVYFDVEWNKFGTLSFLAFVKLYYSSAATGGTWILADSIGGDGAEAAATDVKLEATVALDVDFDLRLELTYSNPGADAGKTEVVAHGEDHGTFPGVQYKKKGVRISSSRIVFPVGVDLWQVE